MASDTFEVPIQRPDAWSFADVEASTVLPGWKHDRTALAALFLPARAGSAGRSLCVAWTTDGCLPQLREPLGAVRRYRRNRHDAAGGAGRGRRDRDPPQARCTPVCEPRRPARTANYSANVP